MALKLIPVPSAVKKIRQARQLSQASLAVEANVAVDQIESIEASPTEISKRMAFSIAGALAVPVQFLFSRHVEVDANIPDFRTVGNKPAVLTSAGLARIARARSITAYLADSAFENQGAPFANVGSVELGDVNRAIDLLSTLYRPIKDAEGRTDPTLTFRETRVALERSGIIVLCDRTADGFRGFCFAKKGEYPVIFINTSDQRPATKLFTLMHEAVHVLLGSTGVSDPVVLANKTERFCNSVVASIMMPADAFEEAYSRVSSRSVRSIADYLSRWFGASKQAAAIRVSELKIDRGFYSSWIASLPAKIPPILEEDEDDSSSSGGGGISSQIARFGYLLPKILTGAVNQKNISPYDAYRLTHLRPSTISAIAARSVARLG